ncbi:hypothetical protein F5890DRAFT_383225 [Lentinula detonsa]|uniref:Uncharacterized protein n=1 Tax=Lentinula detonsa TaxID=2804962 RepID=A0AA38PVG0_9AGAR|nr:hypothetical protein F5890DRAFT_383225 [Lentinula detonsa]
MKFFASSISSFLFIIIIIMTLTITTVNAATDAEKACGFVKKVGTPCTVKLDRGHTLTGTCQKKSGVKVFRHRTCVPNTGSGTSTTGSTDDTSSSAGAGASTDTSSSSSSTTGSGS